jgi:hypothetical protein
MTNTVSIDKPEYDEYTLVPFKTLLGKTLVSVDVNDYKNVIRFTTTDNETYLMFHEQDCCEDVWVEDIVGDWNDVIGSPIVRAEESRKRIYDNECCESSTWTYYKLATIKGYVDIRWCGTSNGYYSESVDFVILK